MATGTITEAKRDESEDGTYTNNYGTFHRWLVTIQTDDGEVETNVLRKVKDGSSKDPNGEPAEKDGDRWKVAQKEGGSSGGGKSPAEQKSITRQGAEQRAALYLIAKAMVKQHLDQDLTREDFVKLVNWMEADAHN